MGIMEVDGTDVRKMIQHIRGPTGNCNLTPFSFTGSVNRTTRDLAHAVGPKVQFSTQVSAHLIGS